MKQHRIPALALAAALTLSGCGGYLGSEPTLRDEPVTVYGRSAVNAALSASNVPYQTVISYNCGGSCVTGTQYPGDLPPDAVAMEPSPSEIDHQTAANAAEDLCNELGLAGGQEPWQVSFFSGETEAELLSYNGGRDYFSCWTAERSVLLDAISGKAFYIRGTARDGAEAFRDAYAGEGEPDDGYAEKAAAANDWMANGGAAQIAGELAELAGRHVSGEPQIIGQPWPESRAELHQTQNWGNARCVVQLTNGCEMHMTLDTVARTVTRMWVTYNDWPSRQQEILPAEEAADR